MKVVNGWHPLFFFFHFNVDHRDLHSFPTRRSSDLATPTVTFPAPTLTGGITATGVANLTGATLCTDRKSTRLNSSHVRISYAVFCLKKKKERPSPCPCA